MIGEEENSQKALKSMLWLENFWQEAFVDTWFPFKETWSGMHLLWTYPGGTSNQEAAVFAKVQMKVSKPGKCSTTLHTSSTWSGRQHSGTAGKSIPGAHCSASPSSVLAMSCQTTFT